MCLTLCNPMDGSLLGSSVHVIFQARILDWVAISFSRGSFQHRERTSVSHTAGRLFTIWPPGKQEIPNQFSSVQPLSCVQPHGLQHVRPPCSSPTPRVYSNSSPLSQWCHPTISSSVVPFSPAFNLYQHQGLFKWVSSLHQVVKVLEFQLQHQSFQWIFRTDFI